MGTITLYQYDREWQPGTIFGFCGTEFDEVRLQMRWFGYGDFDPNAYDIGAYDAINFGGVVVPEPTSVVLIFGSLVSLCARRRR
jgi:hypothetical protein